MSCNKKTDSRSSESILDSEQLEFVDLREIRISRPDSPFDFTANAELLAVGGDGHVVIETVTI